MRVIKKCHQLLNFKKLVEINLLLMKIILLEEVSMIIRKNALNLIIIIKFNYTINYLLNLFLKLVFLTCTVKVRTSGLHIKYLEVMCFISPTSSG